MTRAINNLEAYLESEGIALIHPAFLYTTHGRRLLQPAYNLLRNKAVFEEALGNTDITAWVCYNDEHALAALHFLQGRGVRVPQDISLAGFDDTLEAAYNTLTSYNFNVRAIVGVALDFILRGVLSRIRDFNSQVSGFVAVRRSTGKAPRI